MSNNNKNQVTWDMANANDSTRVLAAIYLGLKSGDEELSSEEASIYAVLCTDVDIRKRVSSVLSNMERSASERAAADQSDNQIAQAARDDVNTYLSDTGL